MFLLIPTGIGTNAWWLGHLRQNSDVDLALSEIAATGYKVVRTWGFGTTNNAATSTDVYYQVLNSSGQYFNYNPSNGIPRLDYVVAAAETYGLQLVLPLLNNFDDLGGINTYTNAYGGSHNDFYTNTAAQSAYKKYIKLIVNRYKSSCAIFAWQLANEPRCSTCDPSVIYNWASDISKYIKSLDHRHMVSLGDEGWLTPPQGDGSYAYSGYEGVDFVKNLAIPTLDYGTFHLYPSQWGYNYTWGNEWIEQHNAIGKAAGKPVVLEEYGVPDQSIRQDVESEWQQTVLEKTSVAYDSFWQFGSQLPSGTNPFDGYAIYYNTSEYEVLGNQHAKDMSQKKARATL
ncbi:MAG: hypothetical protein HETSPECPRED_008336 [Heterodermia speciosa]|uniref:mannan endo-1,4-beta-mannosidase n=1 Tax=Heterodermia speciosa TaxID=116794 RepID=A0A8H3IT27_9LECA|nr:MAG: hypothetical protein HETSPECPRED_008336 [Heterodermia speciosa]